MKNRKRIIPYLLLLLFFIGGACQVLTPGRQTTPTTVEQIAPTSPSPEVAAPTPTTAVSPTPETAAKPTETETSPVQQPEYTPDERLAFASFNEQAVKVEPALVAPAAAPDLSNVYNPFALSQEQLARLAKDGFVVSPGKEKEFFTVYEKARYANAPIFVTSDSLLHSYHLLFDKVLRTAESNYFIPLLRDLNRAMLQSTDAQYQALKGAAWEENARYAVAFIAVGSQLLDPTVTVPDYVADLVKQELNNIESASGFQRSAVFPYLDPGEDYTQYIPRSHYTLSEDLKAYFKSMMWYGRMTFRLKGRSPEEGRQETRSALLIVQALRNSQAAGRPALDVWADLYSSTVFFVGRSDDLLATQYGEVMDAVYGPNASVETLANDALLDTFIAAAEDLPAPRILGMVIFDTDDVEAVTKGLRFMGQRFVPDAYIFRQLVYRNVGTPENPRSLPKGLDLLAVMGSERAYQILEEMGETSYENYVPQFQKARQWLAGLKPTEWTETLYNTWLYSFFPLLETPGKGYPQFMQSQAWKDKQINAVLGSWAELKHDTLLYAKQVYAELGGGPPAPDPVPPRGYVEPVPKFYARLAALTEMTRSGLDGRGLLDELDRDSLMRLENLANALQTMAEKELRGEPLTEEEFERIRYYGGELEHLVMASADSNMEDPFAPRFMDEEPQAAVVADVATDPNSGKVLEEAVGRINEIHVLVPLIQEDGSIFLQIAKGGVFSYYEFPWPMADRLTDEKWRAMLEDGSAPSLPEWTQSFYVPQGEYSDLQLAVFQFQQSATSAFWDVAWYTIEPGDPLAVFSADLDALRQNKQYMGHQLVGSNVLSVDVQSENKAVVVVQETWQDGLYAGEYPEYETDPIARRGPYTWNASYQLELVDEGYGPYWKVTGATFSATLPDWVK